MRKILPRGEFDGQVFIDASGVEWHYHVAANCWLQLGKAVTIPVADGTNAGLLSKELKFLLDRVPDRGGGFAIVTKPHLKYRSQNNPDGVLFGDIRMVSHSLDIRCVHSDGREIEDACLRVAFKETDELPPGFDINFSEELLDNLCVVVPGGPGLPGEKGPPGDDGKDGTGDGPRGLQGLAGDDAVDEQEVAGVRIVDLDLISDVAITKMELDGPSGKFFVTKGQVKVPDSDDAAAQRLIVSQINRGIRFLGDCFDYELIMLPCRPDDDFDTLDPVIAYMPSQFKPEGQQRPIQPVKRRLSDLINDIIDFYQKKLDKIADGYDAQIEEFVKQKDQEARKILDSLGDRLAECENITYLDYCIGLGDRCVGGDEVVTAAPVDPECEALATAVGVPGGECQTITTKAIRGDLGAVFSFAAPANFRLGQGSIGAGGVGGAPRQYETICPDGCWIQRGSSLAFVPKGGRVMPGWTPIPPPNRPNSQPPRIESRPVDSGGGGGGGGGGGASSGASADADIVADLTKRLAGGKILYRKQQFFYGAGQAEFPPGTYAFVYQGGAFKQDRLNQAEAFGEQVKYLIQGAFQDFFVGGEGDGHAIAPQYVINPNDIASKPPISSPITTTEIGLEIGFAPASSQFQGVVKDKFFDDHKYSPTNETGNNAVLLPNPRIDFVGLGAVGAPGDSDEAKIRWTKFPKVSPDVNKADSNTLQRGYLDGFINNRIVAITTTEPGQFFARVKIATSALNFFGSLVMPPVQTLPNGRGSLSVAQVQLVTPFQVEGIPNPRATLNARPVATGEVKIQVVRIVPPAAETPSTTNQTPTVESIP